MTKLEKVRKGLACCVLNNQLPNYCKEQGCPYLEHYRMQECIMKLHDDALELLKERAPVEPKEVNMYPHGQYACGFCGHISVGSKDYHAKFCPECGRELKWK